MGSPLLLTKRKCRHVFMVLTRLPPSKFRVKCSSPSSLDNSIAPRARTARYPITCSFQFRPISRRHSSLRTICCASIYSAVTRLKLNVRTSQHKALSLNATAFPTQALLLNIQFNVTIVAIMSSTPSKKDTHDEAQSSSSAERKDLKNVADLDDFPSDASEYGSTVSNEATQASNRTEDQRGKMASAMRGKMRGGGAIPSDMMEQYGVNVDDSDEGWVDIIDVPMNWNELTEAERNKAIPGSYPDEDASTAVNVDGTAEPGAAKNVTGKKYPFFVLQTHGDSPAPSANSTNIGISRTKAISVVNESFINLIHQKRVATFGEDSDSDDEAAAEAHNKRMIEFEIDAKNAREMLGVPPILRLEPLPKTSPERQIAYERLIVLLRKRWAESRDAASPPTALDLITDLAAEIRLECERSIPHFVPNNVFAARTAVLVPWRRRVVLLFENEWMVWLAAEAEKGEGVSEGIGAKGEVFPRSGYPDWEAKYGKAFGH
ncbi:hypothetical protein EJ05DRAFT_502455 [Pseudovirgaria hyperparasitica]|uniref:Uncharacterized protein n=1 Tax=Pseudovirgaria hyperparasitica TaxID=470096 RepID=A0A6A6W4K7_9PEZI|nr:uncharacterized protein EJ05DRAFT_502455 [Pseudovirgaria hyperparasitica]KAF2755981.1 hypothetical protein EJ05DRAFT_502455 [Pseudovirgaria hyperparasitica]